MPAVDPPTSREGRWRKRLDAITVDAKDVTPSDLQEARTTDILQGWLRLMQAKDRAISAIDKFDELLLPWPERVETPDFQEVSPGEKRADGSEPPGYFRYDPPKTAELAHFEERLREALERAHEHAGPIDAVVFPELALTDSEYDLAERIAFEERSILICGLRQARPAQADWDSNVSVLQVAGAVREAVPDSIKDDELLSELRLFQAKHHRWYLDRDQIVNYHLGGALRPSRVSLIQG